MVDYKFRAKLVLEKDDDSNKMVAPSEWYYSEPFILYNGTCFRSVPFHSLKYHPETIGLSIGEADIQGKEMFTGDYILSEKRKELGLYIYNPLSEDWGVDNLLEAEYGFNSYNLLIVGNIFDNPELKEMFGTPNNTKIDDYYDAEVAMEKWLEEQGITFKRRK